MIDFSTAKIIKIPEGAVQKIACNGEVIWESSYINMVLRSTESDGTTIYNGGLGYKDGYRVRSGGAETSSASICTGFIPAKAGDIIRVKDVKNRSIYTSNATSIAINYSDSSRTNIGQTAGNYYYGIATSYPHFDDIVTIGDDNSWTFTVINHADIRYIRITVYNGHGAVGEDLIVTVNQEIP